MIIMVSDKRKRNDLHRHVHNNDSSYVKVNKSLEY